MTRTVRKQTSRATVPEFPAENPRQAALIIVNGERGLQALLAEVRAAWKFGQPYYLDGRISFRPEQPALLQLGDIVSSEGGV